MTFPIRIFLLCLATVSAVAQSNPQLTSSKGFYAQLKDVVLRSADKLPEESYSFKPSPDVRSYGQVLAHIAAAQYILCGMATTGKPIMKDFEKTAATKAQIVDVLKQGFGYCDEAYAGLTDETSAVEINWFGQKRTKLSILNFNIAHGYEHYGNLVTYMRMKGVVPPSSEPVAPPAKK
jgi:uncharacterized damage-inducible protein DinB